MPKSITDEPIVQELIDAITPRDSGVEIFFQVQHGRMRIPLGSIPIQVGETADEVFERHFVRGNLTELGINEFCSLILTGCDRNGVCLPPELIGMLREQASAVIEDDLESNEKIEAFMAVLQGLICSGFVLVAMSDERVLRYIRLTERFDL